MVAVSKNAADTDANSSPAARRRHAYAGRADFSSTVTED